MSKNDTYSTIEDATIEVAVATATADEAPSKETLSGSSHAGFKPCVGKRKDRFIGIVCVGLILLIGSLLFVSMGGKLDFSTKSFTASNLASKLSVEVSTTKKVVDACTFSECNAASCDRNTAPYTCIEHNGGPHGGCSPIPWTIDTCDKQCDLSDCSSTPIPNDEKSCKHVKCEKNWCLSSNAILCPHDLRYQCLEGSARFGCSNDLYQWGFKTPSTTCSKCCDTMTC